MDKYTLGFVFDFLIYETSLLVPVLNDVWWFISKHQFKSTQPFWNESVYFNCEHLLRWAAKNNFYSLCVLAQDLGAKEIGDALFCAAYGGHENLCRLFKDKCCPTKENFRRMLSGAAQGGHENLCRLAKEWGADNFNDMLYCASLTANEQLCRLAKEWGARNFERMMINAVHVNDERLCRLAKKWGADNFFSALTFANSFGFTNIAELVQDWLNEKYPNL